MSRILVVEDDGSIGPGLVRALGSQGHTVDLAVDGAEALRAAAQRYELVVLDLGLPDVDGLDLCGQLRATMPGARVLMLTARAQLIDVVAGLDAGADDYLAKPFRLPELLARVRAQLRGPREDEDQQQDRLEVADLVVDRPARRVTKAGREIRLPPKEFDLLSLLMAGAGRVMARERIMAEVWDAHWFGPTNTLDTHISTLRRRLQAAGGQSVSITVVRGVGYRLEAG